MRNNIVFFVFLCELLGGCNISKSAPVNLDALLKCGDYDFRESYFTVPYNGCIYDPKGGNNFGNATIYLLPAKGTAAFNQDLIVKYGSLENTELGEQESARINALSTEAVKQEFVLLCFIIDSQYLDYYPNGELRYVPKNKYLVKAYKSVPNNAWTILDSFFITSKEDVEKEQQWKDQLIEKSQRLIDKPVIPGKKEALSGTDLYAFDSLSFDLDGDSYLDKLVMLEPYEKRLKGGTHSTVTYKIFKGAGQDKYQLWGENKKILLPIDDNCPASGYNRIVVKVPYFTIEQQNCYSFMYVNQFITFKYDSVSKKILLHKFGEQYSNRAGDDDAQKPDPPQQVLTPKEFGQISFEQVNTWDLIQMNLERRK